MSLPESSGKQKPPNSVLPGGLIWLYEKRLLARGQGEFRQAGGDVEPGLASIEQASCLTLTFAAMAGVAATARVAATNSDRIGVFMGECFSFIIEQKQTVVLEFWRRMGRQVSDRSNRFDGRATDRPASVLLLQLAGVIDRDQFLSRPAIDRLGARKDPRR